ncbi:hypothetical protein [Salinicoccus albus]|uniref:DUF1281 family ferredoxin-like fold protein n=1 Tax=Salinicoccus albus TaxID=418756 RepID=UPI0003801DA0|nr:hypothetical protein [Salinicoccus albus]
MANLAFSILRFSNQEDFERMAEQAVNDKKQFDLNTIASIPEALFIDHSTDPESAIGSYYNTLDKEEQKTLFENLKDYRNIDINTVIAEADAQEKEQILVAEERIDLGQKYYENMIEHGYTDAEDWSVTNWGTKWYVKDTIIDADNLTIGFTTAWVPVEHLMSQLFEQTEIPFTYQYANDDWTLYGETAFSPQGRSQSEVDEAWVQRIFGHKKTREDI